MNQSPRELPASVLSRIVLAVINQRKGTMSCPEVTQFTGKIALVTGSTGGIGKEISLGLLKRGIRVITVGRNRDKLDEVISEFQKKGIDPKLIMPLSIDLADISTLIDIEKKVKFLIGDDKISILIENAGIWPMGYSTTKQGHEAAFGTNVLGHHILRKELQKSPLSADARIVITTGDIYIMEDNVNTDLKYRGPIGGMKAYCQSKLGNIWIAHELQKRFPDYTVCLVHPGVIASNLGGSGGIGRFIKSLFLINTFQGSQTSLYCATQNDIIKGGYYHNVNGLSSFPDNDPALNEEDAKVLWEKLENIAKCAYHEYTAAYD